MEVAADEVDDISEAWFSEQGGAHLGLLEAGHDGAPVETWETATRARAIDTLGEAARQRPEAVPRDIADEAAFVEGATEKAAELTRVQRSRTGDVGQLVQRVGALAVDNGPGSQPAFQNLSAAIYAKLERTREEFRGAAPEMECLVSAMPPSGCASLCTVSR